MPDGIIVNVTPLEPGVGGHVTLEFFQHHDLAGENICQ